MRVVYEIDLTSDFSHVCDGTHHLTFKILENRHTC